MAVTTSESRGHAAATPPGPELPLRKVGSAGVRAAPSTQQLIRACRNRHVCSAASSTAGRTNAESCLLTGRIPSWSITPSREAQTVGMGGERSLPVSHRPAATLRTCP